MLDAADLAQLQSTLVAVFTHLLKPLFTWRDPYSYFFWPFLVVALGLCALAYRRSEARREGRNFFAAYFPKAIWGHRSALADYRYWYVNQILFALALGAYFLSTAWVARSVRGELDGAFGAVPAPVETALAAKLLLTILYFIAYDFGRFLAHYTLHRVTLLWLIHKVHHSAEVLTPLTNARAHPLELFWMAGVPSALGGIVLGVFMHVHGADTGVFTIFGLHVFVFVYNAIGNLRHSHVWLSWGPRFSYVFVSPAQHQLHHSTRPEHFGRNIGYALALWDWLFGTIYVPAKEERFAMGLGDGSEAKYLGVVRMYVQPFIDIARYLASGRASSGAPIGAPTPQS